MDKFISEKTNYSPRIVFDPSMNYFEISGMSRPENTINFYKPVIEWLREFFKRPDSEMILNFRMVYFNTASSKLLLSIVNTLEQAHKEGKKVEVLWSYEIGDEDMHEAGLEFKEIAQIPFTIQESQSEFS